LIDSNIDGKFIQISVINTGIGIEGKNKLFKKGSSSSGYGLFLSKEILSITGITGEGARFAIIFPHDRYRHA
jgi:signal transduction histidine kinase